MHFGNKQKRTDKKQNSNNRADDHCSNRSNNKVPSEAERGTDEIKKNIGNHNKISYMFSINTIVIT